MSSALVFAALLVSPNSASATDFLVSDPTSGLYVVDSDGMTATAFPTTPTLSEYGALATDYDGAPLIVSGAAQAVYRVNPISGQLHVVTQGGLHVDPIAVAVDSAGQMIVVDFTNNQPLEPFRLVRYDRFTDTQSIAVPAADLLTQRIIPMGIDFDRFDDFYMTSQAFIIPAPLEIVPAKFLRIDFDNDLIIDLMSTPNLLSIPVQFIRDSLDRWVVAELLGSIVTIESGIGHTTVASGSPLAQPIDVAEGDDGRIYVVDPTAGGVFALNEGGVPLIESIVVGGMGAPESIEYLPEPGLGVSIALSALYLGRIGSKRRRTRAA